MSRKGSRKGFKQPAEKAPEEAGEGHAPVGRRNQGRTFDGGGYEEGTHGRGPTPYKTSHSAKPGTLEQHAATAGRGGTGLIGKGDGVKTRTEDVAHPTDHSQFEELGRD